MLGASLRYAPPLVDFSPCLLDRPSNRNYIKGKKMIITIDEYVEAINETSQRTIEDVVDVLVTYSGPEASLHLIQSNGNIESMDITHDFEVTRYTNNGVLIEPKAGN